MDYAHIYKNLILVNTFKNSSHDELVVPLESGIFFSNSTGKKIMTFGLPKKLRKKIEKMTDNFFKVEKSKTKYTVMTPNTGSIIELAEKKDTPEKWYLAGVYIMTESEKNIFKEYFDCGEI